MLWGGTLLGFSATWQNCGRCLWETPPVIGATKAAAMKGKWKEERGSRQRRRRELRQKIRKWWKKEIEKQNSRCWWTHIVPFFLICQTSSSQGCTQLQEWPVCITRTSGPRAELNHWQAKAARRYLLSEIESARRTDLCWHVSSHPCQLYLIVPIATCGTIIPTIQGACSTWSVSSHPHQTEARESHSSVLGFNRTKLQR